MANSPPRHCPRLSRGPPNRITKTMPSATNLHDTHSASGAGVPPADRASRPPSPITTGETPDLAGGTPAPLHPLNTDPKNNMKLKIAASKTHPFHVPLGRRHFLKNLAHASAGFTLP